MRTVLTSMQRKRNISTSLTNVRFIISCSSQDVVDKIYWPYFILPTISHRRTFNSLLVVFIEKFTYYISFRLNPNLVSRSTTILTPGTDNLLLFCCTVIAQGINAGDLKKLQDAGIFTCNGLMMNTKKADLLNLSRFGYFLSTNRHKDFLVFIIFFALTANHSRQICMLFAGFVKHKGLVRRKS